MNMKDIILAIITLFTISLTTYGEDKPVPPKGFTWKELTEIKGACLIPDNWYFNKLNNEGSQVYTISPEKTKSGKGIDIGLTINVIKKMEEKSKVPAATYALYHLAKYVPKEDFISFSEAKDLGKFQIRHAEVIRKKDDMRVFLRTYANKETDTLFIITFGAPSEKWEEYLPYKKAMFNLIFLDDDI